MPVVADLEQSQMRGPGSEVRYLHCQVCPKSFPTTTPPPEGWPEAGVVKPAEALLHSEASAVFDTQTNNEWILSAVSIMVCSSACLWEACHQRGKWWIDCAGQWGVDAAGSVPQPQLDVECEDDTPLLLSAHNMTFSLTCDVSAEHEKNSEQENQVELKLASHAWVWVPAPNGGLERRCVCDPYLWWMPMHQTSGAFANQPPNAGFFSCPMAKCLVEPLFSSDKVKAL